MPDRAKLIEATAKIEEAAKLLASIGEEWLAGEAEALAEQVDLRTAAP